MLIILVRITERCTYRDFRRLEMQQTLSCATLEAQQKSNETKTRNILQITYGHVPEWHPLNNRENVLVYDIHEHLRTILIDLRDAVRAVMGNELDSDAITVDLVYCYPDEEYKGNLPVEKKHSPKWRLITSGDTSCTLTKYLPMRFPL